MQTRLFTTGPAGFRGPSNSTPLSPVGNNAIFAASLEKPSVMQNRSALWIFTILLALACLWQLSFSFFTSRMEKRAKVEAGYSVDSLIQAEPAMASHDRDSLVIAYENRFLRTHGDEPVYPLLGYTYSECKEREMNLGLDLKGGMAVTLEVSVPELVENMSGNSTDVSFRTAMDAARKRMASSSADFITLFGEEYAKVQGRGPLSAIFYTRTAATCSPATGPMRITWPHCAKRPIRRWRTPSVSCAPVSISSVWPNPSSSGRPSPGVSRSNCLG